MRHGSNRRQRNRSGAARASNPGKSRVFDSNGPDVRIRGTAFQVTEKYLALAKDAAAAGDKVLEESYLQHAEHYQRLINSWENDMQLTSDRSHQENDAPRARTESNRSDDDDLGLPRSILGPKPEIDAKESVTESA